MGGVAAAMTLKLSLSTAHAAAPSECHGAEFTAFEIEVSFRKMALLRRCVSLEWREL